MTEPVRLPCQCPKTARLAGILLFTPVIEFEIKHNPSLGKGKYEVDRINATINASEVPIPVKVLRSLTINESLSTNDVLLSLRYDPNLRAQMPALSKVLGKLHDNLMRLVECGLQGERLPPNIPQDLSTSLDEAAKLATQLPPAMVAVDNVLPNILNYIHEIRNTLKVELYTPNIGRGQ